MSSEVRVWDEYVKRRGVTAAATDVYDVPKGYRVITVAHPKLGAEAASKYREYMNMGFQPMKKEPSNSPFGIGVTDDAAAASQSHDKAKGQLIYIPAFETDNAGNVCLPGKREIVMIGREAVANKIRELLASEATERLTRALTIPEQKDSPGFAGAAVEAAPEESEAVREAVAAEAEAKERKVRRKDTGGS